MDRMTLSALWKQTQYSKADEDWLSLIAETSVNEADYVWTDQSEPEAKPLWRTGMQINFELGTHPTEISPQMKKKRGTRSTGPSGSPGPSGPA
jgi:hypothetical protein